MRSKCLAVAILAASAASLAGGGAAHATVVEPHPLIYVLPAAPGVAVATGALVTTIGASVSLADEAPSSGWGIASVIVGSLSLVSGGVYTGVASSTSEPAAWASIAASGYSLGASSLVLGIVNLTADGPVPEAAYLPRITIDAGGMPSATVQGTF